MNFEELKSYALESFRGVSGARRRRAGAWDGARFGTGEDGQGEFRVPAPPMKVDGLEPFGADQPSRPVTWG
jgi:hypothetical protein